MKDDKHIKEYLERMKELKLSESSRARVREELEQYAELHGETEGVRVAEGERSMEYVPQRTSFIGRLTHIRISHMTAAILIAVMIGGGTSFAAQGAVPGDLLYPVKTEINENVQSAFAVSNASEAALQARLAEERLEEAEELAARGTLNAETATQIRTRLEAHYREASERSERAETEGDLETSAIVRGALEGTFRSYSGILSDIDARAGSNSSADIISDIETYADVEARSQATATTNVSSETSVNVVATVDRAESLVEDVQAQLERAGSDISAEARARIRAQLENAVDATVEARASLREELYREAYAQAQRAIQLAKAAEARIKSMLRLDLDLDLDIRGDADDREGTERERDTRSDRDDRATGTQERERDENGTGVEIDVGTDVETEGSVDTGEVDANAENDTSVNVNSQLGI